MINFIKKNKSLSIMKCINYLKKLMEHKGWRNDGTSLNFRKKPANNIIGILSPGIKKIPI